ncbi:MAG: acetylxylan esterase [Mucilaginibacter sp.]|nr:acetylxylan esterase [Mucilaginibacter sp.]
MKRITVLICTGIMISSYAIAQTSPPVQPPATPAAPAFQRPPLTPEQKAAAEAQAAVQKKDYQNMLDQLHITQPLRQGASGSKGQPNSANYDESKANPYPTLPDPLIEKNGKKVTTVKEWETKRRPEIIEDFDREIYGRMPKNTPKVTWKVVKDTNEMVSGIPVITKKLIGHVDNSSYPAITVDIDLTLSTPANATGPVPVMMVLLAPFNFGPPRAAAPGAPARPAPLPGAKELLIQKGWGYALLNTNSIQADNGAGLTKGIIGLMNKGQYRKPDDWGALRAWAWGADRALDYFETDKAVNAKEVGIEGHSRWGKGALVTLAYDKRFAIGYISSSGEGGAKLHRRNAGELVENVAGQSEYHWMAGNFIKYAGPLNYNDLPVDSHELIAICAPRPVFIGTGTSGPNGGDSWTDGPGMFMAAAAAGPVYKLYGKKDLGTNEFPPIETMLNGDVAFRQHTGGHTDAPNWPHFITYASQYIK